MSRSIAVASHILTEFSAHLRADPDPEGLARAIASEAFDRSLPVTLRAPREDANARIESDGIARLGRVVDDTITRELSALVSEVRRRGWPPVAIALHPAPWQLVFAIARVHFGPNALVAPRFWLTHVAAHEGARGWRPHLDATRAAAGDRLTCHVALTTATTDNGCIQILPREVAGDFPSDLFEQKKLDAARVMTLLQSARALICEPGEVILWSKNIAHWGGRATADAVGPRVSITAEIAHENAVSALGEPVLLDDVPGRDARVHLVAHQIKKYAAYEMERARLAPFVALAESLVGR